MATIITRSMQLFPLTNAQIDQNFINLNEAVIAAQQSADKYTNLFQSTTGGRVRVGGTDNGSDLFQVNGTMRATGASQFGGAIGDVAGLRVPAVVGSVNGINISAATAGLSPNIGAIGNDINIGMLYYTKGTSPHQFTTGGGSLEQFRVAHTSAAVNFLQTRGRSTGSAALLEAVGADTNIDFALLTRGTGVLQFGTFSANADAAVNGYITIKDAAGNVRKLATIA